MALPNPTAVSPVQGYIPQGTRRYIWVSTMSSYLTPTSAEITAGTDYTSIVAGSSGWSSAANSVDFPNAGNLFTPKIPGPTTADDSTLTFNMSKTGAADARATFTRGTSGFLVICWEGIISSGKCSVFPATVMSANPSADIAAAGTMDVNFSITLIPAEMIAIPTA